MMIPRRAAAALLIATCLVAGGWSAAAGQEGEDPSGHSTHRAPGDLRPLIARADPGDEIWVPPGHFMGNLVIDKPLTLVGTDRPMLMGDGTGSVITITAPGTVVRGFGISSSGPGPVGGPAGIRVEADDVLIEDNVIEDSYTGIFVEGADGVRIEGNVIRGRADASITEEGHATIGAGESAPASPAPSADPGMEGMDHDMSSMDGGSGSPAPDAASGRSTSFVRGDGISLWNCTNALVRDNRLEGVRDGVYMSFGVDILVDRNQVLDSRYAIHSMFARRLVISANGFTGNLSGAVLMYGSDVFLLRNTMREARSSSTGFGVLLKDVAGVKAVENVIVGNWIGIQIDGPAGDLEHLVEIHRNTVALNQMGVGLYPSAHAVFSANSFVENTVQVAALGEGVQGKNTWSAEGVGNYWSDYRGYDAAGDGVGDVPHHEGGSVDDAMFRSPSLAALSSGPAFSLIRAVEDRWIDHEPIVEDQIPLMEPVSPPLGGAGDGRRASVLVGGLGLVSLLLAGVVLLRFRRPGGRVGARLRARGSHAAA